MRGYIRPIAPGIPLVSISASVVALRFLADPRVIPRAFGAVSAFVAPALTGRLHHKRDTVLRFFPWVHAVPLDEIVVQAGPPRVMDIPSSSKNTNSKATGAGEGDAYPTSALLWKYCQLEAMRSLHYPWTLGLANGRTSHSSFKRYVAQDAHFLRAFAKAYAYALIKVQDEEGVRAFHSLIGSVLDELTLHTSYATKWGIDIHNVPAPVKATTDYVDFLLAVSSDPASSVAQVLASMAPCMRLYAFLGKELQRAFPQWRLSPYAEWIETYSSQDFESAAALVESLLDAYSTEVDFPSLLALYRKAMDLEYAFFVAQSQGTAEDDRPAQVVHEILASGDAVSVASGARDAGERGQLSGLHGKVALLCVDFDDTLTDGDTTSLLVKTVQAQRETTAGREVVEREWARLTSSFYTRWSEVMEESLAAKLTTDGGTESPVGPMDREGLEDLLRKLDKVDLESIARVADSKVLRGITRESVQESFAGPLRTSWKARQGMGRCLSRALTSPFDTHVVSINWSRDVIKSVLSEAIPGIHRSSSGARDDLGEVPSVPTNLQGESNLVQFEGDCITHVSSNDLVYDEHGVSKGDIAVNIPGAFGKHKCFLDIAATVRRSADELETSPCKARRCLTIYVGDSVTDLLAMLDADVGIVVGNSGTLERVASAFGIPIRPLSSAYDLLDAKLDAVEEGSDSARHCVYRVSHWEEIEVFLFGHGSR